MQIEATTESPPGTQRRGQLHLAGTEREEIEELTELNERRLAAAKDRLDAQAREKEAATELLEAMERHHSELHVVKQKEGLTKLLYRYEDEGGVTRSVYYQHKITKTESKSLTYDAKAAEPADEEDE